MCTNAHRGMNTLTKICHLYPSISFYTYGKRTRLNNPVTLFPSVIFTLCLLFSYAFMHT